MNDGLEVGASIVKGDELDFTSVTGPSIQYDAALLGALLRRLRIQSG